MTPAEMSAGLRRQALEMPPFDASAPDDEPFVSSGNVANRIELSVSVSHY